MVLWKISLLLACMNSWMAQLKVNAFGQASYDT